MINMYQVDPGDPRNDQALAWTRQTHATYLHAVQHMLIISEKEDVPLSALMSVLVRWFAADESMDNNSILSLLALSMVKNCKDDLRAEQSSFANYVRKIVGR